MELRQKVQELLDFLQTNPQPEQVYERFYDENVIVQENLQQPRVGRSLSIQRQQQMNANVKEVHEFKLGAVLVDGERSVIEAHIDLTTLDGHHIRIEELAMQTWKDGRIIQERFFYDPANIQGVAKEINAIH
ncbi:MAG: nuclear transport factor 2 family protein [Scytonematopsis contorta HA4267-MV1]|jgi:ketosteroid isomerase-like protein|nr:nuclear transport factor 2 family protein [Scytonematopsis contorta HA4267-MV1]